MNARCRVRVLLLVVCALVLGPRWVFAGGGAAQQPDQQPPAQPEGRQATAETAEPAAQEPEAFGQEVPLVGLSEPACQDVYETVLHDALIKLDYSKAADAPTERINSLSRHAYLGRPGEAGDRHHLLIGLKSYATQDSRLYLWGQTVNGDQVIANSDVGDLAQIAETTIKAITEKPRTFALAELSHETYQLSHVDVPSCVKMLGQLGFNTGVPKGQIKLEQLPTVFPLEQAVAKPVVSQMGGRGGATLTEDTLSAPENRLLIVYHSGQSEQLAVLKDAIENTVDIPARQVLIEGMVIELIEENFEELGVEWAVFGSQWQKATFEGTNSAGQRPFVYLYDPSEPPPAELADRLQATLTAIIEEGSAEILSSPQVLVLNNRNAQIRVIREVPIFESLIRETTTNFEVRFETVGIILNIKPRVDQKGQTVAMQVNAEISEAPEEQFVEIQGQSVAPIINRREVSTIARVHDNTPFIIGGLIRNEKATQFDKIPVLWRIPFLGNLFQRRTDRNDKREVIVVLTPRVIRPGGTNRPAMPKDDERFDFLDNRLFRNSYRLKAEDVFDLGFLEKSEAIRETMQEVKDFVARHPKYADRDPFSVLSEGRIPGEDAVVVRMLFEIARDKLELYERIPDGNLLFFKEDDSKPAGFDVEFFSRGGRGILAEASPDGTLEGYFERPYPKKVLFLRFDADAGERLDSTLEAPVGHCEWIEVENEDEVQERLLEINALGEDYEYAEFAFAINEASDLVRLKSCIALREMATVNNFADLLRLENFRVGRKFVIPEFGRLEERMYLVDHTVAEFFYKSDYYYHALKQRLEQGYRIIEEAMTTEGTL